MKTTCIAIVIWIASFTWGYWETKFFGSNWYPSCLAELICDGVCLLGATIAVCLFIRGDKATINVNINNKYNYEN